MPVIYKFLIQLYIRGINPLADLYLASVILRTLMDLKEVAEGPVLIQSSQREEAAEPRPVRMDTAPALSVQEGTGLIPACHPDIGQDNTRPPFTSRGPDKKLFRCHPKVPRKAEHIQRVQYDG